MQKLATAYPQAVHYPLRSFIAETDLLLYMYQSHKSRVGDSSEVPMVDVNFNENCLESLQMCVGRARELLHQMHNSHPNLIATIELMMKYVIVQIFT